MVLNLAFYAFTPLSDPKTLRDQARIWCAQIAPTMKGSILFAPEGINAFLAGPEHELDAFLKQLGGQPELSNAISHTSIKRSWSEKIPFNRMIVKAKKEIISMGIAEIDPKKHTGKRLAPEELKSWYDQGKPFRILDTRNRYEIRLGSFKGVEDLSINHFRQFPERFEQVAEEFKSLPLVMFCTGGIRCEKATAWALKKGIEDVYQLEGGILGYFEKCGSAHYEGECFVFDQRVALGADLSPTGTRQCYQCRSPLTFEDQAAGPKAKNSGCVYCASTHP